MSWSNTERPEQRYAAIDRWSGRDLVAEAVAVQQAALAAVSAASASIADAIEAIASRLGRGGRMIYVGAGSSGMIALLDALEMPGTFGIDLDRVPVILAGGDEATRSMPSGAEDDADAATAAVDGLAVGPGDAVVAITASGSTPFTVSALQRARALGALTVGIASVAGTPLLAASDHPILVETPPELIAGSTRMGAGTAQKCVLNILSTGTAVRLGHVYAGLMVNMRPENAKLKQRAAQIVAQAAQVDIDRAQAALAEADWSIKAAIVVCAGGVDAAEARTRLARSGGYIKAALSEQPTA